VHPRAGKIAFVSYRYHRPVPQEVAFSVGLDDPSVCRLCDQSRRTQLAYADLKRDRARQVEGFIVLSGGTCVSVSSRVKADGLAKGVPVTIQARLRGTEWVADDIVVKN
jgi:hypothetical protein